jgi:hypothetical protein
MEMMSVESGLSFESNSSACSDWEDDYCYDEEADVSVDEAEAIQLVEEETRIKVFVELPEGGLNLPEKI